MNISVLLKRMTTDELINLKISVDRQVKRRLNESTTRIINLDISPRSENILKENQINTLEELSKMSVSEFLKIKNVGNTTLREMTDQLNIHGLKWAVK